MVRHSREDALDEETFERLIEATDTMAPPFDSETMFILVCGGRLGMRAGEISHCRKDWIDWDRQLIEIPRHQCCDCGYCRQQAEQAMTYDDELSFEEAMERRWRPKTSNSARAIPFDFNERTRATVEAFFEEWDEYPHSRVSVNRRVSRVAAVAGLDPMSVYPHALRATAASWHAYQGVTAVPLQSLFGWASMRTAQKYIRLSGGATARALRKVHSES